MNFAKQFATDSEIQCKANTRMVFIHFRFLAKKRNRVAEYNLSVMYGSRDCVLEELF